MVHGIGTASFEKKVGLENILTRIIGSKPAATHMPPGGHILSTTNPAKTNTIDTLLHKPSLDITAKHQILPHTYNDDTVMMDCDDENDNSILKNNDYLTLQGPDASSHNVIAGEPHKTTSNEIAAAVPVYLSGYPNNQSSPPVCIHLNSSPTAANSNIHDTKKLQSSSLYDSIHSPRNRRKSSASVNLDIDMLDDQFNSRANVQFVTGQPPSSLQSNSRTNVQFVTNQSSSGLLSLHDSIHAIRPQSSQHLPNAHVASNSSYVQLSLLGQPRIVYFYSD